ncbi:MAG: hypothetical protein ABWY20_05165 [Mycobacterium sp.]
MTVSPETADLDRILIDPRGVIIDILAVVEPGLDPGAVRESIDQVATNRAVRRELARTLAADPQLLTSGRPEGPVALGN